MLFITLFVFMAATCGLAWFLLARDHGEKEPVAMLWAAAAFGIGGAVLAGWLEGQLIQARDLQPGTAAGPLLAATIGVGAIEEVCKFLPLALVLYKRRYFNEHTDGVIYFALAGLGFGLPENILYTLQYGAQTGVVRLLLTPLFHAATTGIVGYFLAKNKLAGRSPLHIVLPLAAVIALHALYDFGLLAGNNAYRMGALVITLGVSAGLFVAFLRATEHDQDAGLSAVGHNAFCRSCGGANPRHHLYCVHCGKNA